MLGSTNLEEYISIFKIREQNSKFELCTINFDEFSLEELKDELEEILSILDITPYPLQHKETGPHIIEAYRILGLEKSSTDGYILLLRGDASSPLRDFESYLRIVVGLNEDDIQIILKQYNSKFIKSELSPGVYSIKDISEVA